MTQPTNAPRPSPPPLPPPLPAWPVTYAAHINPNPPASRSLLIAIRAIAIVAIVFGLVEGAYLVQSIAREQSIVRGPTYRRSILQVASQNYAKIAEIGMYIQVLLAALLVLSSIGVLLRLEVGKVMLLIWAYVSIPITIYLCENRWHLYHARSSRVIGPSWLYFAADGVKEIVLPVIVIILLHNRTIDAIFQRE